MNNGKELNDAFQTCRAIGKKEKLAPLKFGADVYRYMPIFGWAFYLSSKCTRKCPQCYTFSNPMSNKEMPDEMFKRLLDFIAETHEKSNIAIHQLTFMGGEPLLRTDRVKQITEVARTKTSGMVSVLVTNGDLLDTVNWHDLEGVTVWGMNITDLPLAEIDRRITIIRKNHQSKSHTLFATLDYENLEENRMEEVVAYGLENNCRFRFTINSFKGTDEAYKKRVLAKLHSIVDVCEKYHAKGYAIPTSYILDKTIPHDWEHVETKHKNFTPYLCGRKVISIKADGDISPCIRHHGISIGNIYEQPEVILEKLKQPEWEFSYANKFIDTECMTCDVRFVCQGGCPLMRLMAYGKIEGKFPLCQIHKEIIPRLMAITRKVKWAD